MTTPPQAPMADVGEMYLAAPGELREQRKNRMTPPHPFDNAIHLDTVDGNVRRGCTHPEWANQVGPFGGITAAVICVPSKRSPTASVSHWR